MTKILAWNCRGLGSPRAINALKRVITLETPQIIFLSETKLKVWEKGGVKKKLRNTNMVVVSCEGEGRKRSGGVALLWSDTMDINIITMSINHIDSHICKEGAAEWRFTGVYGPPEEVNKHKTTCLLRSLRAKSDLPWVCGGDFNLMLYSHEKQGGNGFNMMEAVMFGEAMEHCQLGDLGYVGNDFTWSNNQYGDKNI